MKTSHCLVCDSPDTAPIFALKNVPIICNQLWPNMASAKAAPTGDVDLRICNRCAMVWNASFDPDLMVYAPGYENALHFSPNFRAFAEALATRLVSDHDLVGKDVFEIGCGDGYMLDLVAANGAKTATGFDPTMRDVETPYAARDGVTIVPEYFRSDQLDRPFDAILCRHVLEHLDTPMALLNDIRTAVSDRDVPVYFEVPNAGWMLDEVSMWDVIYEHVGYWTIPSISVAFAKAGFGRLRAETGYGQQFLMVDAQPSARNQDATHADAEAVKTSASRFAELSQAELTKWGHELSKMNGTAVIWGAGSKGITFANAVDAPEGRIVGLVDLNTRKHGLYAPGVGLQIVAPNDLKELRPDLVLISNALYETEIIAQVHAMGLDPAFHVIAG